LSEQAIVRALVDQDRPAHLDRCDVCTARAAALGRWLDDVAAAGESAADAVFSPERRHFQQAQILRRLEQLDAPRRVLSFPGLPSASGLSDGARWRVAPAWVAVAAAAGVLVGVVAGQLPYRLSPEPTPANATVAEPTNAPASDDTADALAATSPALAAEWEAAFAEAVFYGDRDFFRPSVDSLETLDAMTPRTADLLLNTTR